MRTSPQQGGKTDLDITRGTALFASSFELVWVLGGMVACFACAGALYII